MASSQLAEWSEASLHMLKIPGSILGACTFFFKGLGLVFLSILFLGVSGSVFEVQGRGSRGAPSPPWLIRRIGSNFTKTENRVRVRG